VLIGPDGVAVNSPALVAFSALTLLVGRQEGHPAWARRASGLYKIWGVVQVGTG